MEPVPAQHWDKYGETTVSRKIQFRKLAIMIHWDHGAGYMLLRTGWMIVHLIHVDKRPVVC